VGSGSGRTAADAADTRRAAAGSGPRGENVAGSSLGFLLRVLGIPFAAFSVRPNQPRLPPSPEGTRGRDLRRGPPRARCVRRGPSERAPGGGMTRRHLAIATFVVAALLVLDLALPLPRSWFAPSESRRVLDRDGGLLATRRVPDRGDELWVELDAV